jgi:hypothetical protein
MKIIKLIFIINLIIINNVLIAQTNKSGNNFIFGSKGTYMHFVDTINKPFVKELFSGTLPTFNYPFYSNLSSSVISDSANGNILFACNGMQLFDTTGNIMKNGDTLVPLSIFNYSGLVHTSTTTQGSLILPKGSGGLYYVFIPTLTDSNFTNFVINQTMGNFAPYDLLQYHIIDINANNGLGKVVSKNIPLLNKFIHKTGLMACKHANGYDWWLLKQANYDSNVVYRFLVTADSIYGPMVQTFPAPKFGVYDIQGQSCFNKAGTKYAYCTGYNAKLFIADFNRCDGKLSNVKELFVPIDSTTHPSDAILGRMDSAMTGLCFSENDSFLYISREYNIYQYELQNTDSSAAWYHVKHGFDTTFQQFAYYGNMFRGLNNRIYIGKGAIQTKSNSVIDYPNLKGSACGFCRKCLRADNSTMPTSGIASMPDFTLGANPQLCWPAGIAPIINNKNSDVVVYPNPASNQITINYNCSTDGVCRIFNSLGEEVQEILLNKNRSKVLSNISDLSNGLYTYSIIFDGCNQSYGKLSIIR